MKNAAFLRRAFSFALAAASMPATAFAQAAPSVAPPAAPVSAPAASVSAAPELTPEQQAALEAAIIKASQNPVGNIAIIPFQNNFNYGSGPYQRLQYQMNLQPVVPIVVNRDLNLIARIITPIINQPSFAPPAVCASAYGCPGTFGIGDLNPQFYLAPKTKPGALIWGAGAQFLFPTGTPSILGSGKYGTGPAIVGLIMPGNIVTGVLLTQMFSVAGDPSRAPISTFLAQPFFNYNLKGAWAVFFGSSGITANWTATPRQGKWTVPVGTGVTKTFKLGDQPMQVGVEYFADVVRSADAPDGTIRFTWALLFPIKRGQQLP
jgi:hypothetical protein